MGKLQAAQESQCTLQSECEQYRSVLAETVRLYTNILFLFKGNGIKPDFFPSCSIGGDAENTSEECRGGGEGVEDPDNGVRGQT